VSSRPNLTNSEKDIIHQAKPLVESLHIPESEGGLNLGQVWSAIRRNAFLIIIITTSVTALSVMKALNEKPTYSSKFQILTKSLTAESKVVSSVPQTIGNQDNQKDDGQQILDKTKIKVLLSPGLLLPVVQRLQSKYPDFNYDLLTSQLKIESTDPNILSVKCSGINSSLVKDITNALSQAYLMYSLNERQRDSRQGLMFVNQQIPSLEVQVSKQQDKLQRLRLAYNFTDPDMLASQYAEQAKSISQSLTDVESKINETRLLYKGLKAELERQPVESAGASALDNNVRYQKLLAQVSDMDTKLAQESEILEEDNPKIQELRGQRKKLVLLLQREASRVGHSVDKNIQELDSRKQALSQSSGVLNQKIRQLSIVTGQYSNIQRELKIATDTLNQFLTKREALRIEAAQQQIPWQLLTPPNDPEVELSGFNRTLSLGMILGILLGVATALVVDRLSDVIHTRSELKDITNLPILGAIPFNPCLEKFSSLKKINPVVETSSRVPFLNRFELHDDRTFSPAPSLQLEQHAAFLEAFRSAYVNVRLLSPDNPISCITVSSPGAGNGKTISAINLAIVAATMGQRVLLIDADLRRPMLHQRMNLDSSLGLTDLIAEKLDLCTVVQQMSWEKNLFVLPAGTTPPDPTQILSSQAMRNLIIQSQDQFDLVILDAPPLLGLADSYLLSSLTDGILLVVPLNHLKRSVFLQALEALNVSSTSVLGIIANLSREGSVSRYKF
jgi:polysaccharide biosynthesis transport protein